MANLLHKQLFKICLLKNNLSDCVKGSLARRCFSRQTKLRGMRQK